jgi:hypothetical protein
MKHIFAILILTALMVGCGNPPNHTNPMTPDPTVTTLDGLGADEMGPGYQIQINPSETLSNGQQQNVLTPLTWTSSNPDVAIVVGMPPTGGAGAYAIVTSVSAGTSTVTAAAGTLSATGAVTVSAVGNPPQPNTCLFSVSAFSSNPTISVNGAPATLVAMAMGLNGGGGALEFLSDVTFSFTASPSDLVTLIPVTPTNSSTNAATASVTGLAPGQVSISVQASGLSVCPTSTSSNFPPVTINVLPQ